jgi:peptidoglycan/xylan/chitin deacetylase (PgdA/CDA1 family)
VRRVEVSLRWLFRVLSPAGKNGRLAVLIFHRVLAEPDPLFPGEPDAAHFEIQMRWLRDWFNVLPLEEAVGRLRQGSLPARAAAVTFDDGYADNYTLALPILERLGIPATFFIATGFLNGGRMFNDVVIEAVRQAKGAELDLSKIGLGWHSITTVEARRSAIASIITDLKYLQPRCRSELAHALAQSTGLSQCPDLMLNTEQVRRLAAAGMTLGAHTVNHPILARVSDKEALEEMRASKEQLESLIRQPVTLFAYPNGKQGTDYTAVHVELAREAGFTAACAGTWGAADKSSDLFQIPRFTPWDRSALRYGLRLARNLLVTEQHAA